MSRCGEWFHCLCLPISGNIFIYSLFEPSPVLQLGRYCDEQSSLFLHEASSQTRQKSFYSKCVLMSVTDAETERKGPGNILERSGELRVEGEDRKQDLRALCLQHWLREGMTKNGAHWAARRKVEKMQFHLFFGVCGWFFYLFSSYLAVKWFPSHSGVDAKPNLLQTFRNAVTLGGPANAQIHPPERLREEMEGWGAGGGS